MNKLTICVFSLVVLSGISQAADPTAPEAALQAVTPANVGADLPVLALIRSQGRQYLAILDGELVRAGQQHRGYLVRSITATAVTVQLGNQQWQLSLFQQNNTASLSQTEHN